MGAAASFDNGLSSALHSSRYFCHACHRVLSLTSLTTVQELRCPHCLSTFLEELGGPAPERRTHTGLSAEQARRISNAAAMLRILESQLREELAMLQLAFSQASQAQSNAPKQTLTKVMRAKIRSVPVDLDLLCSQPSCPVCAEDFSEGVVVDRLPCGHLFHGACVTPWLQAKLTCPICRAEQTNALPSVAELQQLSEQELRERLDDLLAEDPEEEASSGDPVKERPMDKLGMAEALRSACERHLQRLQQSSLVPAASTTSASSASPLPLFSLALRPHPQGEESFRGGDSSDEEGAFPLLLPFTLTHQRPSNSPGHSSGPSIARVFQLRPSAETAGAYDSLSFALPAPSTQSDDDES